MITPTTANGVRIGFNISVILFHPLTRLPVGTIVGIVVMVLLPFLNRVGYFVTYCCVRGFFPAHDLWGMARKKFGWLLVVGLAVGAAVAAPSVPGADIRLPNLLEQAGVPGTVQRTDADGLRGSETLQKLDMLPVKGRAPKTGYDRAQFGPAWKDIDRNGCDTRNDILRRDLKNVESKPGNGGCVILSGTLNDPYTGVEIGFRRGKYTSSLVQIDHVVALSNAWQTGAQQLSQPQREALANDPDNLLAVDGAANMAKSDGDAATWLPPNKGFRCAYVSRQVQVKSKYGLWVTPAEKQAIIRVLKTC